MGRRKTKFDFTDYYFWLIKHANDELHNVEDYSLLLNALHSRYYQWILPMDQNRSADGKYLRYQFCCDVGRNDPDEDDYEVPCSVLEMIMGLAIRISHDIMEDQGSENPAKWFWIMLDNLEISMMTDDNFNRMYIDERVNTFVCRAFRADGYGGLFPLKNVVTDQRNEEIWVQMNNWLNENCG